MNYKNVISLTQLYSESFEEIKTIIQQDKDQLIVGSNVTELLEYYSDRIPFEPVELDPVKSPEIEFDTETRLIRADQREWGYQNEGDINYEYEFAKVTIPIKRYEKIHQLIKYRGSSFSLSWSPSEANWTPTKITVKVYIKGYNLHKSDDQIKNDIDFQIRQVKLWIENINNSISIENERILAQIHEFIVHRQQKLQNDKSKHASLARQIDIPLKVREDEATKRIQLDTKPLVKKIKPTPSVREDYQLDRKKVLDIIQLLDNQGRQFEKTPKTYRSFGEEDLRNVLLVSLNAVFEGKATGETFIQKGKSDIYLNIDKGNILVCECKIWGGGKKYGETIDQLIRYLTWRQNYGIIITFIQNKSSTAILKATADAIKSHHSYTGNYTSLNQTHFKSDHVLPNDDQKSVEFHHLFYNLYYE